MYFTENLSSKEVIGVSLSVGRRQTLKTNNPNVKDFFVTFFYRLETETLNYPDQNQNDRLRDRNWDWEYVQGHLTSVGRTEPACTYQGSLYIPQCTKVGHLDNGFRQDSSRLR